MGDAVLIEGGAILRDSLAGDVQAVRDARVQCFSKKSNFRRQIWSSDSGAASSDCRARRRGSGPSDGWTRRGADAETQTRHTRGGASLGTRGGGLARVGGRLALAPEARRPKPGGFRAVRGVTFDPGAAPDGATAPRFSRARAPGFPERWDRAGARERWIRRVSRPPRAPACASW